MIPPMKVSTSRIMMTIIPAIFHGSSSLKNENSDVELFVVFAIKTGAELASATSVKSRNNIAYPTQQ